MQLAHDAPLFPPGLPRLAAICAAQNISREPCPTLHGRSRKELVRCGLALSVNTRIIKTRHLTSVHAVACPSFAHTVTEPNRISPPANSGKIGNGRSGVYGGYVACAEFLQPFKGSILWCGKAAPLLASGESRWACLHMCSTGQLRSTSLLGR